jgi:hypothetical protein
MPPVGVESLEEQLAAQKRPMQRHPPIHPFFRIFSLAAWPMVADGNLSHLIGCRSARKDPLDKGIGT